MNISFVLQLFSICWTFRYYLINSFTYCSTKSTDDDSDALDELPYRWAWWLKYVYNCDGANRFWEHNVVESAFLLSWRVWRSVCVLRRSASPLYIYLSLYLVCPPLRTTTCKVTTFHLLSSSMRLYSFHSTSCLLHIVM